MTIVVLLLVLLTVGEALSSTRVVGHTGDNVTLNCKYDVKPSGVLAMCWNRGAVPRRWCNNQLISTDGHKVTTRASSRYQLLGQLDKGDVSLTILNVRESDAGQYWCRVNIPGWFNDKKHHFDLVIEAPQMTPWTRSSTETWTEPPPLEPTPTNQTPGQLTSAETTPTSSIHTVMAEGNDVLAVVLVFVLFALVAGLTVAALVIGLCSGTLQETCKSKNKTTAAVTNLLNTEFESGRHFITSDVLSEQNRAATILEASPCFQELDHLLDALQRVVRPNNPQYFSEMRSGSETFYSKLLDALQRVVRPNNPQYFSEMRSGSETFYSKVQFHVVMKKSTKPPKTLNGAEHVTVVFRAQPLLFPSSTMPPEKQRILKCSGTSDH
ncbi:uncharacterized protein V6R79_011202 [Siganus canaliculatus]